MAETDARSLPFIFAAMEKAKPEATFENRVYYFNIVSKSPEKLVVNMYSTEYTFLLRETGWENAGTNKNIMIQGLVDAVVLVALAG